MTMTIPLAPFRDGLPEQVTTQPLTLDGRTWAVLCRWCSPDGGEHIPVTRHSATSEESAKADAQTAAWLHADEHRRAIEAVRRSVDYDEQARRLNWTRAQANTMNAAHSGNLHHDQDGYFILDMTQARHGRGRTAAAHRIQGLLRAGFLTETNRDRHGRHDLHPTKDGHTALAAWNAVHPTPAPPRSEPAPDQVPPLWNGDEAARRARAARARTEAYAGELQDRAPQINALINRAEDEFRKEQARHCAREDRAEAARAAEERARGPWTEPNPEIGNVITSTDPAPARPRTPKPATRQESRPNTTHDEKPAPPRPASPPTSKKDDSQPRTARTRQARYWRTRMHHLHPYPAERLWHIKPGHPGGAYADTGQDLTPPDHHAPTLLTREGDKLTHWRGACLACPWEGPEHSSRNQHDQTTVNAAIEEAHDHTHPGWRTLPHLDNEHARRNLADLYPPGWADTGAPLITRPAQHRHHHQPPTTHTPRYQLRITPTPQTTEPAPAQPALF